MCGSVSVTRGKHEVEKTEAAGAGGDRERARERERESVQERRRGPCRRETVEQ